MEHRLLRNGHRESKNTRVGDSHRIVREGGDLGEKNTMETKDIQF